MSAVLVRPRELLGLLEDRHGWLPEPGSRADTDLTDDQTPDVLKRRPLENGSTYLRVGSDHLAGVAALYRGEELLFAPAALCRVAFEHVVRAVLAVDPRLTPRQRAARAVLDDVVSAYFTRLAVKELVGGDRSKQSFRTADEKWQKTKEVAAGVFEVAWEGVPPRDWTVDGLTYVDVLTAPQEWRALRGEVPAAGFYAALSLYTHPQSLPEEVGFVEDTGVWAFTTDLDFLAKCSMNTVTCWVDGTRALCCEYLGWDVPELDELARTAAELNLPSRENSGTTSS